MLLLSTATLLSIAGYSLLLFWFARGWKRLPEFYSHKEAKSLVFVSVIIPFRDEAANLPQIIKCLELQTYSLNHLEVIFVNDASSDGGSQWIEQQQTTRPWLKVIDSNGTGKKEALRTGIAHSTGELIITSDADCRFGKYWIQSLISIYLTANPDLIVAPVSMEGGTSSSAEFQKMDYLALQMTTAGAMGVKHPVMCSGANLSFRKAAYLIGSEQMSGKNFLSGDDVFLLHAMKKKKMKTIYAKSSEALVKTSPAPSLKAFLLQRARWGGKSKAYRDPVTIATALIVLLSNALLVTLLIGSFFQFQMLLVFGFCLLIKAISDWSFLSLGHRFFNVPLKIGPFILFSFLYPFYIVVAALTGLFLPVKWKNRRSVQDSKG